MKNAAVFEGPPTLTDAIIDWAVPIYAGFILGVGGLDLDSIHDEIDEIYDTYREAIKNIPEGGHYEVQIPRVENGTLKKTSIRVEVEEGSYFLLVDGKQKSIPTPTVGGVAVYLTGPKGVLKRALDSVREAEKATPNVPEDVQFELLRMGGAPLKVAKKAKTFKLDPNSLLRGWKPGEGLQKDPSWWSRVQAFGLHEIVVEFYREPATKTWGEFNPTLTKPTIRIFLPSLGGGKRWEPGGMEELGIGSVRLSTTIRHEVAHVGQYLLRVGLGLSNFRGTPRGAPEDTEFYPWLGDAILMARQAWLTSDMSLNRFVQAWVGEVHDPEANPNGDVLVFFRELKGKNKEAWKKAVSEFYSGIAQ
jgi:hypothetical protein